MKNINTAILTIQRVKNYGAALQAFALQSTLFKMGVPNEIIDFRRVDKQLKKVYSEFGITGLMILKIIVRLKQFRRYLINVIYFKDLKLNKLNQKNNLFNNFDLKYLIFSKEYKEVELLTLNNVYENFICGSDQVWNHTFGFSIEAYFLNFVKQAKNKVSFAPSFGIDTIPNKFYNNYKESFNNFTHISVREVEGAKIIKEITGIDVPVLLDPIFLLTKDDWIDTFSLDIEKDEKPYILCYTLGNEDRKALDICKKIAKDKEYDIVRLGRSKNDLLLDDVIVKWNVGPIEFLELIVNSKLVVTNSFHGTAFSINFNIPFFCVFSKENKRTSRITNILRIFNLENRIVYDYSENIQSNLRLAQNEMLQETISKEREKSINFLKIALS